jgi:hypothetical protein
MTRANELNQEMTAKMKTGRAEDSAHSVRTFANPGKSSTSTKLSLNLPKQNGSPYAIILCREAAGQPTKKLAKLLY